VIIGIVLAGIILWLTGYFTGTEHKPVRTSASRRAPARPR
jgi:K(+)-stimulated pyrophosphate-energized sodium pump